MSTKTPAREVKIRPLTIDTNGIVQAVSERYSGWSVSIWAAKNGGFYFAAHDGKRTSISSKTAIRNENDIPAAVIAAIDRHEQPIIPS